MSKKWWRFSPALVFVLHLGYLGLHPEHGLALVEGPQDINRATLRIRSVPPECEVFINGRPSGMTDRRGMWSSRLQRTRYRILLRKEGFSDQEETVDLIVDQTIQMTLRQRGVQLIILTAPPDCDVSINDKEEGQTDSQGHWEKVVEKGDHTIRITKEGFRGQQKQVILSEPLKLEFQLTPLLVDLFVVTEPGGAKVKLQGSHETHEGETAKDGQLILPQVRVGVYNLLIEKERYVSVVESIKVSPPSTVVKRALSADTNWEPINAIEEAIDGGDWEAALSRYIGLPASHAGAETALQSLVNGFVDRSQKLLAQMGLDSASLSSRDIQTMSDFFKLALDKRENDPVVKILASYWSARLYGIRMAQELEHLRAEDFKPLSVGEAQIHHELGLLNLHYDPSKAEGHFRAAIKLKPHWPQPHYSLGRLYGRMANLEADVKRKREHNVRSIMEFSRAIMLNPAFYQALAHRALAYMRIGKNKEALLDGERGVTIAPDSALANYALGYAYVRNGSKYHSVAQEKLDAALSLKKDQLSSEDRSHAENVLKRIRSGES